MSAPATLEHATPSAAGTWSADDDLDVALSVFLAHRARLVRIAHQVTRDLWEADDVVQEAWVRWQRTDRGRVENPAAFLTSTTVNLAINVIQSARHRHETPSSTVPMADTVRASPELDPARQVEQTDTADEAIALLLARLKRGELAAYLLRQGFDYAYADLAALLETSTANSRQLVSRAQARLRGDRGRSGPPGGAQRRLVTAFLSAARTGDFDELESLLVTDGRRHRSQLSPSAHAPRPATMSSRRRPS